MTEYCTTTKKVVTFKTTPMVYKPLTEVGGIGLKTSMELNRAGIKDASIFRSICLMCLFLYISSFAQVCNKYQYIFFHCQIIDKS